MNRSAYLQTGYWQRQLCFFCAVLFIPSLQASSPVQDSLEQVLQGTISPKTRVFTLDKLATSWYGKDFVQMAHVSRQLIEAGQAARLPKGTISGYNKLGTALMSMSRYEEAQEAFEAGYHLADSLQYTWGLVQLVSNLGIVCYYQARWDCAERYYRAALQLNEKPAYKPVIARGYFNLAVLLHDQGQTDSARYYYDQAESVSREIGDTLGLVDVFNSIGLLFQETGKPAFAQRYFQLAMHFAKQSTLPEPLFMPYLNLGRLAMRQGRLARAQVLLDSARWVAETLDSYDFMQSAYSSQSQLDSLAGQPAQALYWARRYDRVKDSLYAMDRRDKLAELQTRFETQATEKELALLQIKNAQTAEALTLQRRLSWAIGGLAVCLAGLALMYFWFNRRGRSMLAQLREAYREKDALLGIVAHDLKAPLANIQGLTQMLAEGQLNSSDRKRVLKMITGELGRGDQLVRDLLELDAIENGTLYMNAEALDLVGFLHQHAAKFQPTAAQKDIALTEDIPLAQFTCQTDQHLLARVLDNLLSNAIKFSPWGRQVHLGLRAEQQEAIISISDEGPGFSEEDMTIVFQKFRRLSAKPTGGEPSTGLGLAIVKGLIESLGGKINLENRPGRGARFEIRLPVATG